jgi:hypothetical protein
MSDVTVEFGAKDTNLSSTIKGFDMSFGKIGLAAGVAGVAVKAGMMAVEAATAAASAVVAGFGQAIDLGGQLTDLSARTGESAGSLLVLQRAFENTGVGAEKVGPSLNKLQKFMAEAAAGGAEQSATLNALGLSMSDLAGKTPSEQMQVLAQKIAGISDPAERARASMEVFGKSGGELLPLLNNFSGELDGARGQLGSLPDVMDRSARTFDDFGDGIGALSSKAMEFAAGFLESALPALNTFTAALSGIDAAGWGQALMKQVMSVADFLIGAFKAPLPAIDAIGAALKVSVLMSGNALVNSFIDAGDILQKLFSSKLPSLISDQLANSLIKAYADSWGFFVNKANETNKAFTTDFGGSISNVMKFFSDSLSNLFKFAASDFSLVLTNPVAYVTKKLATSLGEAATSGAFTFKNEYASASGGVLDKISTGLDGVSKSYGENLRTGTSAISDEFGKLVGSIKPSTRDFFGAVPAAEEATDKLKEVESVGTKLREDFEKSAESSDAAKKNTSGAATDAEAIAGSFNKAEGSTKKIKEDLSLSAKLIKDIGEAEAKNSADKGGKLQATAQQQIASGDFAAARRTAGKIAQNEVEASIRGTGATRDNRAFSDIGKDFGVRQQLGEDQSTFIKRLKDVREGYAKATGFGKSEAIPGIDRPGQDGQKESPKGENASPQKSTLETVVESIKTLLEKIEPRLPVAALTA